MSQAVSPPRAGSLPLGVMPRGLSRVQAAEYVGVSRPSLMSLLQRGAMISELAGLDHPYGQGF